LEKKVNYSSKRVSVQDIVQSLATQAGVGYNRQKSLDQTAPLCTLWVRNVTIEGKPCRLALEQILKPVGLRYQLEQGMVVLPRQNDGKQNAAQPESASRQLTPEQQQQAMKRMRSYLEKYAQRHALDVSTHTAAEAAEVEDA
jgi:uncharacterized caspase-like protein